MGLMVDRLLGIITTKYERLLYWCAINIVGLPEVKGVNDRNAERNAE
jgi:hypothetical protein